MNFRLIKNYWEIILLFFCLIVPLAIQWQIILYSMYSYDSLAIIFICLIGCLIVGVYWLLQIVIMLGYFLYKHKLQYSQVKTLIKITVVPILVFCYILLAVYTDIIRLRLSEPALMNCVNSPNLCQNDTIIGWFYVQFIHQGEDCTFFTTDTWVFNEFGLVYVTPGKEDCLNRGYSDITEKIYGNWWEYAHYN